MRLDLSAEKDTKFLFVSALEYAIEFMKALPDIGAEIFLTKPVDEETLIKKVHDML